jgi:hypothetical protein
MTNPIMEFAQRHADEAMTELDSPEDDIMPVFFFKGPHGIGLMPCVPMRNDKDKDGIAAAMQAAVVVSRATETAFISTSWTVRADRKNPDEAGPSVDEANDLLHGVMPSQHPDRVECITIMVVTESAVAMGSADITRYKDKLPTLSKWEVFEHEGVKLGGRFGEAIDHALRMVQESPPEMVEIIEEAWQDGTQQDLMDRFLKVRGNILGKGQGIRMSVFPVDPN